MDADQDASTLDATPDAFARDAFARDAFARDAFTPESCNAVDDDGDRRIDEGMLCLANQICASGSCQCSPGTYACDLTGACSFLDVTQRDHCGGCSPCDPSEDCATDGGAPHCVPARIVDFTVPFDDVGISCVVRSDGHLICRDIAADGRLFPTGWVDTGITARSVRAWGHYAGGRRVVTVCAHGEDGYIQCFGSPDWGGTDPVTGRLLYAGPAPDYQIEGGYGMVVQPGGLTVWGGPRADARIQTTLLGPERGVTALAFGRCPLVVAPSAPGHQSLSYWGRDTAACPGPLGLSESGLPTQTLDVRHVSCVAEGCCVEVQTGSTRGVQCWMGSAHEPSIVDTEGVVVPLGETPGLYPPEVFPTPAGPRVCVWGYCLNLYDLAVPAPSPRGYPLSRDPDVSPAASSRLDWRASCAPTAAGGFACTGMHGGWPIP